MLPTAASLMLPRVPSARHCGEMWGSELRTAPAPPIPHMAPLTTFGVLRVITPLPCGRKESSGQVMETGAFSPNPPTAIPGPSDGESTPHRSRESRRHSCSSQLFSALVFSRICTLPASPSLSAGKPPSASLHSKAAKPPCSRGSFPGCRRAVPPLTHPGEVRQPLAPYQMPHQPPSSHG